MDSARDDVIIHALAILNILLHFGNKKAQKEIGGVLGGRNIQILRKIHKLLATASSALLLGRYPFMTEQLDSPTVGTNDCGCYYIGLM